MTPEAIAEIKSFFTSAVLPETLEMPGIKISSVKRYYDTNINRVEYGVPLISKISFDNLVKLKKILEK